MRGSVGITLLVATLFAFGSASADTRSACITACDATAQACIRTAHDTYEACIPTARRECAPKPPSEQSACLTTAARACRSTHSDQTDPCLTTFKTCHAACGPRPANQFEFWCRLNADTPGGSGKTYKDAFCAGTPGRPPLDQHAQCMALFTPSNQAVGFSLDCDPL
ncbi:hypothetical protein [Reyranella soli]|uniref:Uncharacterized protein n=1 Tax=Reyranella soli TaxID=1230389 RepID=A0A512NDB6_9HYPH|nr:hypothetical protein [Reyranella soli]GEP56925.1 hypothetical protein RSO01_40910 [Reyranella soli]